VYCKSSNNIYRFDLNTGQLEKTIRVYIKNLKSFVFNEDFYFLSENDLVRMDSKGKMKEFGFEMTLNSLFFNKSDNSLYVVA